MYKSVLVVLVCALMNLLYYHVSFRHSLIFSVINCAVIFLLDYVTLCICMIILPGGRIDDFQKWIPACVECKSIMAGGFAGYQRMWQSILSL